jgi:hypothetical protein
MPARNKPVSRYGWHLHYAGRFNKTRDPQAAHFAMWYLLLSLAFDGEEP